MNIVRSSNNKDRIVFSNPGEAFEFATKGMPKRHPLKYASLSLRSLLSEPERRQPLSVTLPSSSLELSEQMLLAEATRLELVLKSDSDVSNKEIDANLETITGIRQLGDQISQHLGRIAI